MPLRAEYTLHQSDLSAFLSAQVWHEKNGNPLSVLSALARLDMDPWAEAARLAALPKDAAVLALAVILRRLAVQQLNAQDAVTTAHRLVMLLPKDGSITTPDGNADHHGRRTPFATAWLFLVLIAVLVWAVKGFWS